MRDPKYKSQYERYDWLKQHGICVNCGQNNSCIGSIFCPECGEKAYNRNREYQSAHREEQRQRCKEYNKRLYAECKAKGLCQKCGKKAIDGKTLCLSCRIKQQKKKDHRWNNDIERSMRNELGLCYVCGKPLQNHDKLCDNCYERASKRMKELNANPTEVMIKAREKYAERHRQFKNMLFPSKIRRTENETD